MPNPDDFIAAARTYIGVKWMHQGRSRLAVDCVGLVIVALADIGVEIADNPGYRRDPDPERFVGHIREHTDQATHIEPGAIGVFRGRVQPCHVGIFAELYGKPSLIHAYAGQRKVMEELFIHHWPAQLMEIRKIRGLNY